MFTSIYDNSNLNLAFDARPLLVGVHALIVRQENL